jgi:hypothetical protein
MDDFEQYLETLSQHEEQKGNLSSREKILVYAGVYLNSMGDFLANPNIHYTKKQIPIEQVLFTGTSPDWNEILIKQCKRSVAQFQALIQQDTAIKEFFTKKASFEPIPILLHGPDEDSFYRVFDGMHRFVGAILANHTVVEAYVPTNVSEHLPICEAHVVYDLIRAFQRHAKDESGKKELYYALRLLARTYENVIELLKSRFNSTYVSDDEVQEIITRVIKESKHT